MTQAAFEGEDYLSIDPVMSAIEFSADGAKAFNGDNEVTPHVHRSDEPKHMERRIEQNVVHRYRE